MSKGHLSAPLAWVKREISQVPVNNNLLINSNFKNPVNQRGITEGVTSYFIDRWRIFNSDLTKNSVKVNDGYITLNLKEGTTSIEVCQKAEFPSDYNGKIITASVKARLSVGAKAYMRILYYNANQATIKDERVGIAGTGEWGIYKVTTTIDMDDIVELRLGDILIYESDTDDVYADIYNEATKDHALDVEWMKAEIGSQATPYVPRLYDEELQLCQRFYQVLKQYKNPSNYYEANFLECKINYSGMRIIPSTRFLTGTSVSKYTLNSAVAQTGFDFTVPSKNDYCIGVRATKATHGLTPTTSIFIVNLELDAEL